MMDITADIFWIFDEKMSSGGVARADESAIIQSKNSKKEKYTHLLKTIFGVLI